MGNGTISGKHPDPVWLVFIGPHGAGKTTVGKMVGQRLGWTFHHEIGREMRDEALRRSAESHALRNQPGFDRLVLERELDRDARSCCDRVIETWHPGNMGYASLRSREMAALSLPIVEQHLRGLLARVVVQPLRIALDTALVRISEPGPSPESSVRFFGQVAKTAEWFCRSLGLDILPPLAGDVMPAEDLADIVARRIRKLR